MPTQKSTTALRGPFGGGFLTVIALLAAGCRSGPTQQAYYLPQGAERGIVFSADGAGGFEASSASLREVIEDHRLPLRVETVSWSHGYGRAISDQIDWEYAREQGQILGARITALRQACPNEEIYVVAHSAGSAVAMSAVESAPPGSIDRLILLAPSLSADYDIRPGLRNTREGIDVFFSGRDVGYLGLGIAIFGTADRRWAAASGRVGFRPASSCPGDEPLYAKLHQHPWHPCVEWTGNKGGHYGSYRAEFLAAYVLPLLERPGCPPTVGGLGASSSPTSPQ